MDNFTIRMRNTVMLPVTLFSDFLFILNIESIYAQNIGRSVTDPAKRFIVPPDLELKGRENFLSSIDVTLGNQNFDRGFKITVTYNDDDKLLSDHTQGKRYHRIIIY